MKFIFFNNYKLVQNMDYFDLVSSMDNSIKPSDDSMSMGLIILIVCCVLCLSSSSSSYYFLSSESSKLSGTDDSKCKSFTPFPLDNEKYMCPYGREVACTQFEENGYNKLLCPFNYALIADEPEGSRKKILKLLTSMNHSKEDIFNSQYFVKRDVRKPVSIFCSLDMSSCQDMKPELNTGFEANSNRYINITSGDLIKISSTDEIDNQGKPYKDYYAYVAYDIIVTFPLGVGLSKQQDPEDDSGENMPIYINDLVSLKKEFANMEKFFQASFKSTRSLSLRENPPYDFKCDNLERKYRVPKTTPEQNILQKYSLVCFFYNLDDLGALTKLFQETFVKDIDRNVWMEYLNELNTKINNGRVTMFEFIMYLTLTNYLEDKDLKFIFYKKT